MCVCLFLQKKFRRVRLEDSDDEEEIPAVGGVESAGGEGGGAEEDVGMVTQSTHDTDDCAHVNIGYLMCQLITVAFSM